MEFDIFDYKKTQFYGFW